MEEIEKRSKQKDSNSYLLPKYAKILEELNKQSKTIKENEIDY